MEYFKGSNSYFEDIIEKKYSKSFKKNELFKFNHYKYDSRGKAYIYLICYYVDQEYNNKIAEWKYDGKLGKLN